MYNTKKEFFDACSDFDWFYRNSDSQSVFNKWKSKENELIQSMVKYPKFKKIYDDFEKYYFSGKPWNTEKEPYPKFENYE